MSKNHHKLHSDTVATEAAAIVKTRKPTKTWRDNDDFERISDKQLFNLRTLVPAGAAHDEWLAARRAETALDLANRNRPQALVDGGEPAGGDAPASAGGAQDSHPLSAANGVDAGEPYIIGDEVGNNRGECDGTLDYNERRTVHPEEFVEEGS